MASSSESTNSVDIPITIIPVTSLSSAYSESVGAPGARGR